MFWDSGIGEVGSGVFWGCIFELLKSVGVSQPVCRCRMIANVQIRRVRKERTSSRVNWTV